MVDDAPMRPSRGSLVDRGQTIPEALPHTLPVLCRDRGVGEEVVPYARGRCCGARVRSGRAEGELYSELCG